jgi:quercetin dioxygenase-like cupin family protein
MPSPESPEHGALFDLASVEQELRREEVYERNGHAARTLTRVQDLRIVFIAMKAGGRMAEHQANDSASIHVVAGKLELHLPDRKLELTRGQLLVLAAGLRHDVVSSGESAFLLTLAWSKNE